MIKIASSPTKQGLERLINEFYMSENWIIVEDHAYNKKLDKSAGVVKQKKGRFTFFL